MPSRQRGSVVKRGRLWGARWYDESGVRRFQGGFETRSAARAWVENKVEGVAALRRGDPVALRRVETPTFDELVDEFLAQHPGEANTLRGLRSWLVPARRRWGPLQVDRVTAAEVALWRRTLPERSAWHYTKAVRQVLGYAVRTKLLDENVAKAVPNPPPKPRDVQAFTVEEVDAVAVELGPTLGTAVVFAAWTGMRPEEWIALERSDVDRKAGVARIRRVYTDGTVKQYGKQHGSLRTVPIPARACDALEAMPARIDTAILFPGRAGGFLNLSNFRVLDWKPASGPPGSPTGLRMRSGTPTLPGRSRPGSACSSCRG